jgi:CubicO group peptidase (beta-lactamase class C family)
LSLEPRQLAAEIDALANERKFSGAILIRKNGESLFEGSYGLSNRSDAIPNQINTRFAMASGCKIFTAVAACQLVDRGLISFDTKLSDCLDIIFPHFDPGVTVHHLLTHTSGIPDYFDEQTMDDYAALWKELPMYTIRSPRDFLPMFQNDKMVFPPGEKFYYSESGFIVLGLIVEQHSGTSFPDYVTENVLRRAGMSDSGYFATDRLPERTALNYIHDKETDSWHTNIFSVPIIGAPDGGAFTTAPDMALFWRALRSHRLLSPATTERMLTPCVNAESEGPGIHYGYGVWIGKRDENIFSYGVMGYDPGVAMKSTVYPDSGIEMHLLGNTSEELWLVYKEIAALLELGAG